MEKIMVLGAGTMGAGIAQAFADHGHTVILRDLQPELVERGVQGIGKGLAKLVEKGKIEASARAATLANIHGTTDLALAADCDLVIEAVVERMEIKKQIFAELDGLIAGALADPVVKGVVLTSGKPDFATRRLMQGFGLRVV